MKILYIYDSYPETYQTYLINTLNTLKQQVNVEVLTYNPSPENHLYVKSFGVKDKLQRLNYKLKLSRYPDRGIKLMYAYDVIHLQHSFLFSKVIGLLEVPKNQRPKIIITLRGGDTYVKPWLSKKWQEFYKNYGAKVDGFITMSQHQKQYLHKKWGVSLNKIHVIPISFGAAFQAKPKKPNANVIKIISAFRTCWEKNIDGNLRTVKQLKEKGCAVQYDIYGDGPDSGQVMYLIDKYKLSDCVTYYGKIENTKLKEQLPNYDFFLQLSHSESLGMTVIEAQSYGIPAIVSNSDGLPEVIINDESGYCVPAHDAKAAAEYMTELWKDEIKYFKFSEAAIKNSHNKFTNECEAYALCQLYINI